MPYLIQKQPDGSAVKQWDLKTQPLTVGRGEQAEARVDDKEMSRKHFMVRPAEGKYVVEDLKSTNGTFLNGKPVQQATLKANDKIQAGQSLFVFVDGLATVIGQLEQGSTGYSTFVEKLAKKK